MARLFYKNPWFWAISALFVLIIGIVISIFVISLIEERGDVGYAARVTGPWVGGLVGAAVALFTGLYFWQTREMAKATSRLADETRAAREEAMAPRVVPYFDFIRTWLLHVSVENIGHGIARNVLVTFDPEIPARRGAIGKLPLRAEALTILRPGEKFSHFIDSTMAFFAKQSNNPKLYVAVVSFEGEDGRRTHVDFQLDLSPYEGLPIIEEKTLSDLAKAVEEIGKTLKRVTDTRALRVKTPADIRREHEEMQKAWAEEEKGEQASEGNSR